MRFEDLFESIVRRAQTWDERLAARRASASPESSSRASELREAWTRLYSPGDPGALSRRLSWDGLAAEDVAAAAEAPRTAHDWADLLSEALSSCPALADELRAGPLPESPLAEPGREPLFFELWIPFLRLARQRVRVPARPLLSKAAWRALETRLLGELSGVAEQALLESFDAFRGAPGDTGSRALYQSFVAQQLTTRLAGLLDSYPALARQLGIVMRDFIAGTLELLSRLESDRTGLAEVFGAAGEVTALAPALSDRHNGGRSVAALTFASGVRVVYKPRPVATESAWSAFLGGLKERGLSPAPPTIRFLDRGDYGWAEFVEPVALASEADVDLYFRAAGELLAVAWAFGARDLHMGNVVATARGPVIIDAEMVLQPERADAAEGGPAARELAADRLRRTFVSTGLLSTLQDEGRGRLVEVGGLRGEGGRAAAEKTRVVVDRNTDAMRVETETLVSPRQSNLPEISGRRLRPDDAPEAFASGFESAYRFLLGSRDALAGSAGPLDHFAGKPVRLVFRQSAQYARLLGVLLGPRYQTDGLSRSLAIDSLNRVFRNEAARPALWPFTREEREALESWDLPYFTVAADATEPESRSGERVAGILSLSGVEAARARLRAMSESDLVEQLSILRSALGETTHAATVETGAPTATGFPASRADLLAAAVRIGERVLEAAITTPKGAVWLVPSHVTGGAREDRGGPYYLYDGASGIALFLAALGKRTGRADFLRASRAAFEPVRETLFSASVAEALALEGVGACNGLGSLVYALSLSANFASDDDLVALARRTASHITRDRIAADTRLDVEGGAAGAVLGLLALHALTQDEAVLARAVWAGEHLLAKRHPEGGWPGDDGARRAGFAHGAAGIAVALARLSRAASRADFRAAALDACRYERTLFDAERRNWPVLAPGGDTTRRVFRTAWCHGAPGIALARAGLLEELGDDVRPDLLAALATTRETGFLAIDHVCCGNGALVEALLTAGDALGRPELVEEAQTRAASLLARASLEGGFRLRSAPAENAVLQPGFFTGLSGLGYTFLRLQSEVPLPSVLLFEPAERRPA